MCSFFLCFGLSVTHCQPFVVSQDTESCFYTHCRPLSSPVPPAIHICSPASRGDFIGLPFAHRVPYLPIFQSRTLMMNISKNMKIFAMRMVLLRRYAKALQCVKDYNFIYEKLDKCGYEKLDKCGCDQTQINLVRVAFDIRG